VAAHGSSLRQPSGQRSGCGGAETAERAAQTELKDDRRAASPAQRDPHLVSSRRVGGTHFDRKFGADWLRELPPAPGVYLFKDERGGVLYAGKAKDVRRRLQGYRNATRRKAHRKMRALVRAARSLEVRIVPSERAALLVENELIRTLRPPYNVDGAFSFLYPALGVGRDASRVLLAFTSTPEAWSGLGLRWHGCFRARARTRAAFDALVALLGRLGHR